MSASGTLPPLETDPEPGRQKKLSDHRVCFLRGRLEKLNAFEWVTYQYRQYTDEAEQAFGSWLAAFDWSCVELLQGSDAKAEKYQEVITGAIETFFPLKKVRRRSNDLPWVNNLVRKKVRKRMAIFRAEGRSARWRRTKEKVDQLIESRMVHYFAGQKVQILAEDGHRVFFKNVRRYQSSDKPEEFDVRTLFPGGESDRAIAEKLAEYYNAVSREFSPLEPHEVPATFNQSLQILAPW